MPRARCLPQLFRNPSRPLFSSIFSFLNTASWPSFVSRIKTSIEQRIRVSEGLSSSFEKYGSSGLMPGVRALEVAGHELERDLSSLAALHQREEVQDHE